MKTFKLFIALFVFALAAAAQGKLPVIKSNSSTVSIRNGAELKKNAWTLVSEAKPDVYEAELIGGKRTKISFITDIDSISFEVEEGKKYDFIIQKGNDVCHTRIVGVRFTPAAKFDRKYQNEHRGKTFVEIPEVYELVNVAIALTPTGIAEKGLVIQDSDYYRRMRAWFDKYNDYKVIGDFEKVLKKNPGDYFSLKMNGYSYEFGADDKLVKSKIYDRTGFSGSKTNALAPFIAQLESFAAASDFREFYRQNRRTYDEQIKFYRDEANIAEMKRWLDRNFPATSDYDTYKIIFSPLVGYNQSTTWFESNGFKELQPHVNFPYSADPKLSPEAQILSRGAIVFTEINHGYINPEADKYADRILKATSRRHYWVTPVMGANYPGIATFNEYMNWALVNLRHSDAAPVADQPILIAGVEEMMVKRRGFLQFAEFDQFLLKLYKNRRPDQTLADLYPQIIQWFEKSNG